MRKIIVFLLSLLVLPAFANGRNEHEVVLHNVGNNQGHDQIYVEPPSVTYDDELNELTVYFGTAGSIDLMYLDLSGTPEYYIYGENHYGGYTATYSSLPAGYYTITIHSIYGYTYTGNFTVS